MGRFNLTAARDVLQVPFPRCDMSSEGSSGTWGASTENSRKPDRGARRDVRAPAARRRHRGFDRRRAAAAARRDGGRGQASIKPHHSTPYYIIKRHTARRDGGRGQASIIPHHNTPYCAMKRHTARRDGGRGVRPHHPTSYHVIQRDGGSSKRSPVGYTSCVVVARPDPDAPNQRTVTPCHLSLDRRGGRGPHTHVIPSYHIILYLSTGRWASPSVMKCHTACHIVPCNECQTACYISTGRWASTSAASASRRPSRPATCCRWPRRSGRPPRATCCRCH